jgi:hypothetical protein
MFKKYIVSCIAVFLVFISTATFAYEKSSIKEISKRLIVQIDYSPMLKESFTVSPDSKHVAYVAEAGNNWFVVVDGKEENNTIILGKALLFSAWTASM